MSISDPKVVMFPKGRGLVAIVAEECIARWPDAFSPPPHLPLAVGVGRVAFACLLQGPPFEPLLERGHLTQQQLWEAFSRLAPLASLGPP
jgi:hypothetical protein